MTDAFNSFSPGSVNDPFLMAIEDIFNIKHRGIVLVGRIERGSVRVGDPVEVVGMREHSHQFVIQGLEMYRKALNFAQSGDSVGCLLGELKHADFERGQVLASVGSIKAYKKFNAQLNIHAQEAGGRHTPFFAGYRPEVSIRSAQVTGSIQLPPGIQMVMPGQNLEAEIQLAVPVALEIGTKFTLREGKQIVGTGICAGF